MELQVCSILSCLSAKLSDCRSLWPLSVHCVHVLKNCLENNRIDDFPTKYCLVLWNLVCFLHTLYQRKFFICIYEKKLKWKLSNDVYNCTTCLCIPIAPSCCTYGTVLVRNPRLVRLRVLRKTRSLTKIENVASAFTLFLSTVVPVK